MIQLEPIDEIMVIRLDRAAKKNAQTPEMLASLINAIETSLSARAIVLSGVGDVFCAGFDLSLVQHDEAALPALLRNLAAAVRAVRGAPCPVVASAHGAAIAGGCALLCGCDFAVADENSRIGYPAVKLGISPAVSGVHLGAGVGLGAARTRMLDPGMVDGREAHRIGLVSDLVRLANECEPRAIEIARDLARKPRQALGYTKAWMNTLDGSCDDASTERALGASMAGVGGAEQRERLAEIWKKA